MEKLANILTQQDAYLIIQELDRRALKNPEEQESIAQQKQELESRPTLIITLATPLLDSLTEHIEAWLKANLSQNLIISFRRDKNLVAGLAFDLNGQHHDYSLANKLQKYEQFPEISV